MVGLGLRSNVVTCLPAFIGGLELALPYLVGPEGLCRSLEPILEDSSLPSDERWYPFSILIAELVLSFGQPG